MTTIQQHLSACFEELDKGFHLHWMAALRSYDKDTVHELRLNLKRQNAFFHLLEALDERFSAGIALDTYEVIYRRAGKVRDKQVEKQVIKKAGHDRHIEHDLTAWLEEKESRRVQLLQEYEAGHSLEPVRNLSFEVRNVIHRLSAKGLEQRLVVYFSKLIRGIAALLRGGAIPKDDLHDLRKFIKELFYNLEFLQRHTGPEALRCRAWTQLDELQHLLGKWHDYDFTLEHLTGKKALKDKTFLTALEAKMKESEAQARRQFEGLEEALSELEARISRSLGNPASAKTPPSH
ncbi:MAG: CHAD domain-containing protein [Saprospiraceae bacterium]|nr:CHAD domain-containing protein [Saprospiraceae bacterium]